MPSACPIGTREASEFDQSTSETLEKGKKRKGNKERARVLKEEEKIVKDAIVITISSGKLLAICDATLEIVQTAN